jgi:hypothetical protein
MGAGGYPRPAPVVVSVGRNRVNPQDWPSSRSDQSPAARPCSIVDGLGGLPNEDIILKGTERAGSLREP